MSSVAKSPLQSFDDHLSAHQVSTECRSCGAEVNGKFCASCGEETEVVVPSAGEFLHEFIGHYVALEGKLLKTLQVLVFSPGRLTVDYLAGRRISFISPLRLYLTLSIVAFTLIKVFGVELPQLTFDGKSIGATYTHVTPEKTATLDITIKDSSKRNARPDTDATADQAHQVLSPNPIVGNAIQILGSISQKWMKNLQHFMGEPESKKSEALNYGFLAYLPYMLIGALPLFALYLKLIYLGSGRRYGEHLVFALHTNTFAFLLTSLMMLVPGNVGWLALCLHEHLYSLISAWDCLQVLPFLWLMLYLPAAMRRVYAGSFLATGCRWLVLITAHLLVILTSTIISELIGIVQHG